MQPNTIGFSLVSHWLKKWRQLCHPIIEFQFQFQFQFIYLPEKKIHIRTDIQYITKMLFKD